MIRAILFDNDGTLSDSVPICHQATNQVLADYGYSPVTLDQIADCMRFDSVLRMMDHVGTDDVSIGQTLAEGYHVNAEPLAEITPLFPGIADLAKQLSDEGYLLGVVSNNRSGVVQDLLKAHGLSDLFTVVIGEDNADEAKPSPGGLLQACRLLGVTPEETVYVGDGPSDSASASAANIPSIGVLWNSYGTEKVSSMGFSATVSSPEDLPDLIKNFSAVVISNR